MSFRCGRVRGSTFVSHTAVTENINGKLSNMYLKYVFLMYGKSPRK